MFFIFHLFFMSKKYKVFHIFSILFVGFLVVGSWWFVITEDHVLAQQPLFDAVLSGSYWNVFQDQISGNYDFWSDASFQKYVGNGSALQDFSYVPIDLSPINSSFTANLSSKFSLRKDAGTAFADLARHFRNATNGDKLFITSAYRSSSLQDSLLKKWCSRTKCALVWSSEHQLWLAIDLGVITKQGKYIPFTKGNKYYTWMSENASNWWFHNTYQKGIDVDGQMEEWRHWRYLWEDFAVQLYENNLTLAERYAIQM